MEPYRPTHNDDTSLPDEVISALRDGAKIEAIKRLRQIRHIDLKDAKEQVETYQRSHPDTSDFSPSTPPATTPSSKKGLLIALTVIIAFGWAFITSLEAVSSLIVLANLDGYQADIFTIDKLRHDSDGEGGLTWGFDGKIAGHAERLYAPHLADNSRPEFRELQKLFPEGTAMQAWYNPEVTATLFQGRSLRVIPYTPDLKQSEFNRFIWWIKYALAPLLLVLFLSKHLNSRTTPIIKD